MNNQHTAVRRALTRTSTLALALALAACGGGSADTPAGGKVTILASALPPALTVPEYTVWRTALSLPVGGAEPDTAKLATLRDDSRHLAVTQLRGSLSDFSFGSDSSTNAVAVPALTHATLRGLAAAASGTSRDEIGSHFDLAPSPYVQALQTQRVDSRLWVQRGLRLSTEFLTAIDRFGPQPRLASWSAAEAGFADGTAAADLDSMLSAIGAPSIGGGYVSPRNIHALLTHTLKAEAGWPTVLPFEGIFAIDSRTQVRLPMLRWSTGVTRHTGTGFTADLFSTGSLHVMSLQPTNDSLWTFTQTRLEAALAEAWHALKETNAAPAGGEMLLPQANVDLWLRNGAGLRAGGVNQVYDEVHANLKGLDGVGGTYAQSPSSFAALRIDGQGLSLQASQATAYAYSERNVNGTYGSYGANFGQGNPLICHWPKPDLLPFFVVLLDDRGWVVSIAAIQRLAGSAVVPECRPAFTSIEFSRVDPDVVLADGP